MRLDLYTAEDRAREALAHYRHEQLSRYIFWCTAGAAATALLVTLLAISFVPEQMGLLETHETRVQLAKDKGAKIPKLDYEGSRPINLLSSQGENAVTAVYTVIGDSRPLGTFLAVGGVLFVVGLVSIKLIALYQGVVYGAIVGTVVYGATWIILDLLHASQKLVAWGPVSAAIAVGGLSMLAGLLGAYLPDTN